METQSGVVFECSACENTTIYSLEALHARGSRLCSWCSELLPIRGTTTGSGADNSQLDDELAGLLSQHLHVSKTGAAPPTTPQVAQQAPRQPITFASQHYTQSHHVVPRPSSGPPPHPPPSSPTQLTDTLHQLTNAGIDPRILTPSRCDCFRRTGGDQRRHLAHLWLTESNERRNVGFVEGDTTHSRTSAAVDGAQNGAWMRSNAGGDGDVDMQAAEIHRYDSQLDQSMDGGEFSSAAVSAASSPRGSLPSPPASSLQDAEPYIADGYARRLREHNSPNRAAPSTQALAQDEDQEMVM